VLASPGTLEGAYDKSQDGEGTTDRESPKAARGKCLDRSTCGVQILLNLILAHEASMPPRSLSVERSRGAAVTVGVR